MAALALGFVALVFMPAAPAFAHAALLGTNPGQGSVVQTAPTEVTLTFSEPVSPVADRIRITGPDGERADRGEPSADGTVLKIGMRDSPPIGTYLVTYRVISADSHPVAGGFTFSVGAPSATPPTDNADQGTDPTVTKAIGINKFIGYAGLTLIAGPALVLLLLWPSRLSRRGPRRLLWTGFGLVGFSSLLALLLQAPYTTGTSLGGVTAGDVTDVLGETFGTVLLLRLGVLLISAIVLNATLKRNAPARSDLVILAILGAVGAATWPLVGHPAASPVPTVTIVVDAIHLASMALWIGGLVMLGFFLLPRNGADDRELGVILPVWSRWAGLAVSALLLAGVVQALIEVGTVSALVDTTYGRLLLIKVALVAVVLVVAFASRTLVVRSGSASTLRRNVLIEVAIAAVVIGVTSALVQTTPARVARTESVAPVTVGFNTAITAKLYTLQVQIEPAAIGENTVHLYAYTADGKPLRVLEWKVSTTQAAQGIEGVDVPMLAITDNHASGSISLPVAGDWEFKFTLRTTEIDQETVTATVPIR